MSTYTFVQVPQIQCNIEQPVKGDYSCTVLTFNTFCHDVFKAMYSITLCAISISQNEK